MKEIAISTHTLLWRKRRKHLQEHLPDLLPHYGKTGLTILQRLDI